MSAGILVTDTETGPLARSLGQGADILAPSGDLSMSALGAFTIAAGALAASVAGRAKMADSFFNEATVDSKFEAGAIDSDRVKPASLVGTQAAVVAEGNVIGGIPVVHIVDVPDAATGDVDVTLTHKTRVLDVEVVKTGGAGAASNTITVKNGATAITNDLDMNVADKTVVRAGTIDDAQWDIAAAGTLRVSRAKSGGNAACKVIVRGVRVA
jgi:hypothetical protein